MSTTNSKKGQVMDRIVGLVLALVIILASTYILYTHWKNADEAIDGECSGTCKTVCNLEIGDVQKSSTCIKDGKEDKTKKCCVNAKDKPKDGSKDNSGGTGSDPGKGNVPSGNIIEVRLNDDMFSRIGLDISHALMEQHKEYKISVWGFGPEAKTCEIKFLDKDGKTPTTGFLSRKNKKQDCVDSTLKTNAYSSNRKNILVVDQLIPKGGEVGNYKFNVYLYDKDGNTLASYGIPIRVSPSIPFADDLPKKCAYKSCSEVPISNCLRDGVPNCPELSCTPKLGGVGQPNKCVPISVPLADDLPKKCAYKSCSEVPMSNCLVDSVGGVPNCPELSCTPELGGVGQPNKCVPN